MILYFYTQEVYDTENEAQDAATAFAIRLENNPTDWMTVKEITGSQEAGWVMSSTKLSDAEILNPDSTKTYMCAAVYDGDNCMPLTASELDAKRIEIRTLYCRWLCANEIIKIDDSTKPATETIITPTTDMSGYV